jgi:hypothetical protein
VRLDVCAQALDRGVVVRGRYVEGEVDVRTSAPAGDPDLRALPEPDPRPLAREQPDRLALLPALDDRQPEDIGVERLGGGEVGDLEHELADARDRDARHRTTR